MVRRVNPYLAKIEARYAGELTAYRRFTRQYCFDMMMIAANEAFGFGEERLKKLADTYDQVRLEFADIVIEDTKDVSYSKDKLDRKLQQIMGKNFRPWEERYGE